MCIFGKKYVTEAAYFLKLSNLKFKISMSNNELTRLPNIDHFIILMGNLK